MQWLIWQRRLIFHGLQALHWLGKCQICDPSISYWTPDRQVLLQTHCTQHTHSTRQYTQLRGHVAVPAEVCLHTFFSVTHHALHTRIQCTMHSHSLCTHTLHTAQAHSTHCTRSVTQSVTYSVIHPFTHSPHSVSHPFTLQFTQSLIHDTDTHMLTALRFTRCTHSLIHCTHCTHSLHPLAH